MSAAVVAMPLQADDGVRGRVTARGAFLILVGDAQIENLEGDIRPDAVVLPGSGACLLSILMNPPICAAPCVTTELVEIV